jgi:hypothetical protein
MTVHRTKHQRMHELPCAAQGLISYRYKGPYGWIMIGAKDHDDAMRQAARSTREAVIGNLEVWDSGNRAYVGV